MFFSSKIQQEMHSQPVAPKIKVFCSVLLRIYADRATASKISTLNTSPHNRSKNSPAEGLSIQNCIVRKDLFSLGTSFRGSGVILFEHGFMKGLGVKTWGLGFTVGSHFPDWSKLSQHANNRAVHSAWPTSQSIYTTGSQ